MPFRAFLPITLGTALILSGCSTYWGGNRTGDSSDYNIRSGPQTQSPISYGPSGSGAQSYCPNGSPVKAADDGALTCG